MAGVKLARECVEQIREKQASEAFVAGAIGPLGVRLEPLGKVGLDEARAAFAEQIRGDGRGWAGSRRRSADHRDDDFAGGGGAGDSGGAGVWLRMFR